ncbi:MAG: AraC family transcriptional regulator, partial [Coleofasciculaceae cyanobacterium SM2_3_26]|nr:AraC family transcriptional regulator [Coleofasciculaceae cyanobacterium SM2_3_26]
MTAQLVLNRWEDLYVPGHPNDSRLLHSDPSDRISICPPHLGHGYFQEILLRDDLTLVILDYTLHQDVSIDVSSEGDRLEFEFQIVGADAGYSFFIPYFGLRQFGIKPARRRWFKVEVFFNRPALTTYFRSLVERLSPQIQDLVSRILKSMYPSYERRSPLTNSPRIV